MDQLRSAYLATRIITFLQQIYFQNNPATMNYSQTYSTPS